MSNYSIAEEFRLPSQGKVYSVNVKPAGKIRSMTTQEEMKRLAPAERAYKNICEVIDDCIVEDIGISAYDMCLADYQYLLHRLRVCTYGSEYTVSSRCPFCGTESDRKFDLTDLEVRYYDNDNFATLSEFILPKTQKKIKLKMQTPRIVDDINERAKELKRKSRGTSGESAFLFTVESLIDTVNGDKLDPIKKEDFVRNLPMMDTNYILKSAQKLVESFGVDTVIKCECPVCGLDYNGSFRITSEFFGPSIDA